PSPPEEGGEGEKEEAGRGANAVLLALIPAPHPAPLSSPAHDDTPRARTICFHEPVMTEADARTHARAPDAPQPADSSRPARRGPAPLDHAWVRPIIVGIMLSMFLSALEQTIVAPALPTIGRVLADVENLSFVVTAYLLAATAVTPLFGKLADIHGRRVVLLAA